MDLERTMPSDQDKTFAELAVARGMVTRVQIDEASLEHLADYRIRVNQPAGRVRTALSDERQLG